MKNPLLRVAGVSKRYGNVRALQDVSVDFHKGEIHAILGENGAGKSTLMGVLTGFVVPDAGVVLLDGDTLPLGRSHEMKDVGIRMVHQHFMLVGAFSIAENLALSQMNNLRGGLDLQLSVQVAEEISSRLGWDIDYHTRAGDLPVGTKQKIEILKALSGDARILILDEPTAVLSQSEISEIFDVLRRLRDQGTCVILILHKLREVLQIADRVSVLRNGRLVATDVMVNVDENTLAKWMIGEAHSAPPSLSCSVGDVLFELCDVSAVGEDGTNALSSVSLLVRRGEIVGIGGVVGNGQNELAEICAGLKKVTTGTIIWHSQHESVGYIPPDRHAEGLALGMSIEDNFLIEGQNDRRLWYGPFLKFKTVRKWSGKLIDEYEIKVGDISDPVSSLSGGNQQKIIVSRVIAANPDFIVANNPTRGLDLKATVQVRSALVKAAGGGAAILLFTTDRDELQEISTRTLWMGGGRLYESETDAIRGENI